MHIFLCMGKIFCVEFQRESKYGLNTELNFSEILNLRACECFWNAPRGCAAMWDRRGLDPLPPGFNPPNPAPFFFSGTPTQNSDFLPPTPAHLTPPPPPPPPPFFIKSPRTPAPLPPGPPPHCPPPQLLVKSVGGCHSIEMRRPAIRSTAHSPGIARATVYERLWVKARLGDWECNLRELRMGKGVHRCWGCGAGYADLAHYMLKCREFRQGRDRVAGTLREIWGNERWGQWAGMSEGLQVAEWLGLRGGCSDRQKGAMLEFLVEMDRKGSRGLEMQVSGQRVMGRNWRGEE